MHAGQVIALEIVVDINLPVALHHVFAPLGQLELLQPVLRGLLRQFAQAGDQSPSSRIEVNKDPRSPFPNGNGLQAKLGMIEVWPATRSHWGMGSVGLC